MWKDISFFKAIILLLFIGGIKFSIVLGSEMRIVKDPLGTKICESGRRR